MLRLPLWLLDHWFDCLLSAKICFVVNPEEQERDRERKRDRSKEKGRGIESKGEKQLKAMRVGK